MAEHEHLEATAEWEDAVAFSKRVLAGDTTAYDEVVVQTGCLKELEELDCAANVTWPSATAARVAVRATEADVVPREEKAVTAKGTLSAKKIPAGRITEIYQDFVCGVALRTARELQAILPLRGVLVDVWSRVLNSSTGHLDDVPVLSVYCPREKFQVVDFDKVDASELVGSLRHAMKFTRGKGFAPIQPLSLAD